MADTTVQTKRLLAIPEAANELGLKPRSVYALVYRREISSVKVGRLRKIPRKAIEEFIERRTLTALDERCA